VNATVARGQLAGQRATLESSSGSVAEVELRPGLVIVALADTGRQAPPELVQQLRQSGATLYVTHGWRGCLRVAASVQPREIYLDPDLPDRLLRFLRAHPNGKRAVIRRLA
jgi:hypothetical protein